MLLFGSRARGDYKEYSDIDIAIIDNVTQEQKYKILDEFDKLNTAYKIDVVFTQFVENKEFLETIMKEEIKI